jgi:DNA-directed RNA polymerase specialized sigma24 family protein
MNTTTKKTKHYVNNADFLAALIAYREKCDIAKTENKEDPQIPNYIGECFYKIADHLSRKPNFISYSFRDEMVADGIENCLMYFRNFDPAKSTNPFAYFTQIIYYAFLRRIMKEKKQLYVKYKATEQFGILDEHEMFEDENGNMKQFVLYDNISEFIHTFEENKRKKKEGKVKGVEKFMEDLPE